MGGWKQQPLSKKLRGFMVGMQDVAFLVTPGFMVGMVSNTFRMVKLSTEFEMPLGHHLNQFIVWVALNNRNLYLVV